MNIVRGMTALVFLSCMLVASASYSAEQLILKSPNKQLTLTFDVFDGIPKYQLFNQTTKIIAPSKFGFRFKRQGAMIDNFFILSHQQKNVQAPWQKLWGQSKKVENNFTELAVTVQEKTALERQLQIIFRLYDDGVGFRYILPEQKHLSSFAITAEETEFSFYHDYSTWWTPADYDSYEALYQNTPLSQVKAVNTPITMMSDSGTYISIHEAALTDYAGMTLVKSRHNDLVLKSDLVPWPDGIKVKGETPFKTPWRTIQVANDASGLIESDLIVNLNEASVIADTSWIKPMKYIGIWWAMHMREYTWQAGPKHGATTKNAKEYIDFAKEHSIGGVLVEGWNQGWETWHTGLNRQNFTKAYDDFDLAEVSAYAKAKNVYLIGHHETGGNIPLYEQQMLAAFKLYQEVGVHAIKTGYAGKMQPQGVFHHGQQMVNHYRKVLELAAEHQIMVNAHEPIKPTGIRRTYPNMMTREGGRGMEWNGWSAGNTPEHTVTLPFTRLLAGPMDYTPGIFNIKFDPQQQYRVHSTLAKQLAMYVTLYSPMQMAADMIKNYRNQPAFKFIQQVPTSWDETKVLAGKIGDHITIARRKGQEWFIGSMTDEEARLQSITLDFLDDNQLYLATLFVDSKETNYQHNPTAIEIKQVFVQKGDELKMALAGSGGQALMISPVKDRKVNSGISLMQHNQHALHKMKTFVNAKRFGEITHVNHLALNKNITINSDYDLSYSGGGDKSLIDGIKGGADYKNLWQGYRNNDLDVVIDLGEEQELSSIEIGFLQSVLHSILLPQKVTFSVSKNNDDYHQVAQLTYMSHADMPDYQQKQFTASFPSQSTRYIRVQARNIGKLPDWHIRPGQESFIFADEIIIR